MKRYLHRPILSQLAGINNYFSALNKCILSIEIIYKFSYNIYISFMERGNGFVYHLHIWRFFYYKGVLPERGVRQ